MIFNKIWYLIKYNVNNLIKYNVCCGLRVILKYLDYENLEKMSLQLRVDHVMRRFSTVYVFVLCESVARASFDEF